MSHEPRNRLTALTRKADRPGRNLDPELARAVWALLDALDATRKPGEPLPPAVLHARRDLHDALDSGGYRPPAA